MGVPGREFQEYFRKLFSFSCNIPAQQKLPDGKNV